jgi:predicted Zn-dependent protease
MLLTSEASENQAGDDAWRQINAQEPPGRSPDQKAAVSRVGQAIAKAADRPDYQWEFRLFESTQANAFCLPGGKIAVYSGIFQYMDDDAELAAVVGHEVGHAIARHGGERMSQQLLARAGAAGLSAGLGGANPTTAQLAMIAYGAGANVGAILPYSRAQEYEADHIGMILMAKAGYDPRATISFWEKFAKTSKDSPIAEFFSTHPMSAKRLEEMRHNLPAANSEYQMAPVKKGRGNPIRRLAKPPG